MKKWLVVIIGSISWSLTMIKSGLKYDYGIGFWGPNGHDGVWHLALIENFKNGYFQMPVYSGNIIQNYHLGFDLILAAISKVSGISSSVLYFQIIPPILAVFIGLLTYKFVFNWTSNKNKSLWSTILVYISGGFAWILGQGESHFWSQQSISTLVNPPYALSLIFLLTGLIGIQKNNLKLAIISFIILPHIKIYAGLLAFFGLFVTGFTYRKNWKILFITLLISVPIYLLVNKSSQELIVVQPGWFLESLFSPERLDVPRFFSALNTYRVGNIWHKAIPAFFVAFIIFLIGNMGIRIISLYEIVKSIRSKEIYKPIYLFTFSVILAGAFVPMIFVQKGTAWNTIQFFYYSLFFSSILSGISLIDFLEKNRINRIVQNLIKLVVLIICIPTTFITLGQYLPSRPPSKIGNAEIEALNFLKNQPFGVVLTYPFDPIAAKNAEPFPPRPLRLYESTAYVSAYSAKPTYLEDEVNLNITNYPWKERRTEVEKFFSGKESADQKIFLNTNNITYVYLPIENIGNFSTSGLIEVFSNSEIKIFKNESK